MATVYRQGSRGEEVRKIQQMLVKAGYALKADGDYGQRTADAVKQFQRKAGLTPVDGVVGPKTMERLTAWLSAKATDENANANLSEKLTGSDSLPVVKNPIQTHITFCISRPIRYIAIHYTAGGSSRRGAAMQNRDVFLRRSASADFIVDDEQIVQVNPDLRNYYCWAVGDKLNPYSGGGLLYGKATNRNTISIEICSNLQRGTTAAVPNHAGWSFTEKAIALTVRLVRRLMQQYGIPKERVVRHYDISGKACPGIPGWNDAVLYTTDGKQTTARNSSSEWERFLQRI